MKRGTMFELSEETEQGLPGQLYYKISINHISESTHLLLYVLCGLKCSHRINIYKLNQNNWNNIPTSYENICIMEQYNYCTDEGN